MSIYAKIKTLEGGTKITKKIPKCISQNDEQKP